MGFFSGIDWFSMLFFQLYDNLTLEWFSMLFFQRYRLVFYAFSSAVWQSNSRLVFYVILSGVWQTCKAPIVSIITLLGHCKSGHFNIHILV